MGKTPVTATVPVHKETTFSLENLLLDVENPRFGSSFGSSQQQSEVLDFIVDRFGVDDVLSSIAVNGYFDAEPLVCRSIKEQKGKAIVAEGNRRLAACLILSGDDRARRHKKRTADFAQIWAKHGRKPFDPVPVILFPADKTRPLLSYLGVRHIAASQPWDSYAKAAWVAKVVEQENLAISDVSQMIGDQHRTIARLLEGFNFMRQTIEAGAFRPIDSVRRGRGSVTEYPFSWVYTILGYSTVRAYVELGDDPRNLYPIPPKNVRRAGLLVKAMFGDKSKGINSAITDSRQLGDLASVFGDQEKIALLETGKTVVEIERSTRPIAERLRKGLASARELHADLLQGLSEQTVSEETAEGLTDSASKNRRAASEIEKRLRTIAQGELDESN